MRHPAICKPLRGCLGVETAVLDGLEAYGGGDAEDFVVGGTARKVGAGFGDAEEELAVCFGAGEVFDEFAGDVGAVEVGEDEDVGFSGDEGVAAFDAGEVGDDGGVGLHFAVNFHLESGFGGALFGEGGGGGDFLDGGAGGAAFVGVAEEGDAGFVAGELAADFAGLDGDAGELVHGGFGDDGAVGKEDDAAFAVAFVAEVEHLATGDGGDAGEGLDEGDEGAQCVGGGEAGADDEAVHEVVLEHHGGEVSRHEQSFAHLVVAEAAVAGEFFETGDEGFHFGGCGGVHDADVGESDVFGGGDFFDFGAVADEDGRAEAHAGETSSGAEDGGFGSLGKDDALGVFSEFFVNGLDESHGEDFHDGSRG